MVRLAARSSLSERRGGAQMQFFDGRQPRQPICLARDHDQKRQRGGEGQGQSEKAEAFVAREQVLDQMGDAETCAEQDQSPDRGPEYRAPAQAAPCRDERRLDRDRQQRRIGFGRDMDRAAGRTARILGIDHDHAGVVELEGGGTSMRRSLAHCSLSPIRN